MDTTTIGRQGEEAAAVFLERAGYDILARNFHTRRTQRFGRPAAAVDYRKQQKIIQSARWFLRQRHLEGCLCRFDVIEVYRAGERWQIEHLPGAFET